MIEWVVVLHHKRNDGSVDGIPTGKGQVAPTTVFAHDKEQAKERARQLYADPKLHITICSLASWNCSGAGERVRLIGEDVVDHHSAYQARRK